MKVTWYGTASIGIEDGETKLLFDPFVRQKKKLKTTDIEDYAGADAILVTHGHFDHILDIPRIADYDKNVQIYCTKTPAETLQREKVPADRISVIKPGESFEIGKFKITPYQAKHIVFDAGYIISVIPKCVAMFPILFKQFFGWNMKMPENHEIVMYLIENDGKSVLLCGSFGTVDWVRYPENPDMFILANGGNVSIPELTRPFIESIRPKTVFVDHFDNAFPPLTRRIKVEKFADKMSEWHPEIKFIVPKELQTYEV